MNGGKRDSHLCGFVQVGNFFHGFFHGYSLLFDEDSSSISFFIFSPLRFFPLHEKKGTARIKRAVKTSILGTFAIQNGRETDVFFRIRSSD